MYDVTVNHATADLILYILRSVNAGYQPKISKSEEIALDNIIDTLSKVINQGERSAEWGNPQWEQCDEC